jgi:DNA-binding NarL/FixJ family response regulator
MSIRILVVDDHDTVRGILCRLLRNEPEFAVAEAVTGADALDKTEEFRPDVVLLDISLPDMDGLKVAARMRKMSPSPEILVVSDYCEGGAEQAFCSGASGYLLKSDAGRELVAAVRTVHRKERYLSIRER